METIGDIIITAHPQGCRITYRTFWQRIMRWDELHCTGIRNTIYIDGRWTQVEQYDTDFIITPESLSQIFEAFCQLAQKQAICAKTLPIPIADEISQYLQPDLS